MQRIRRAHTLVHVGRAGVGRVDRYRHVAMGDGAECPSQIGVPDRLEARGSQIRTSLSKQKLPPSHGSRVTKTLHLFGAQLPSAVQVPHLEELLLRPSTVSG